MQTQTSNTLHNAIMEADSKDRPPMLVPGNYVQWKSRIKRYIDTKPNHEFIHYCLTNPPYKLAWTEKEVPIYKGSPITRTEMFQETYKNVSQDIRDQLNAEAEAVQIILTWIDNDIYLTVDACPNACEMWKVIERLKQVNQSMSKILKPIYIGNLENSHHKMSQELKTVSYHKLYDILKQHQNEVNEIRAERIARIANPLALVAQQQPVYHLQTHPTQYTQNSSTRSQQAATRNRGKEIVNSPQPINDQEPSMVAEDDETSKDKEIDKFMALISLSFKKIYKPTNKNHQTSSNTSRANQDNSLRINRNAGIQCYNCKEFGHVARECQKPKRVKDAAYHREKMPLCKQEEAGIQLNAEQADWRGDTDDDELEDQELEAHYMYMAQLQEVSPDAADSGPIFDIDPLQKNDDDNDVANERELLASLIEKLKCEIDESKNRNKFLETSNKVLVEKLKGEIKDFKNKNKSLESSNNSFKEANNKLSETNNLLYTDFKKSKAELERCNSMEYASKMEIEKAQITLYKTREDKEIDKVIALENKVKVLDNIVYKTGQSVQMMNMLNNKCRMSFSKPEFLKKSQRANPRVYDIGCYNDNLALMLAPESDEVICLEKESRSKLNDLIRPFDYENLNNLYDLFVPQRKKSSEQRYFSERSRLSHTSVNNGNSKEFFNKQTTLLEKRMDESIPEYYYADHINEILGVYTELDEVTNLQCDYLELLEKCKCLEIELSKSKMMSKSFEALQKHAINLEIDLQQFTAQTLPLNTKSILKNTNVLAPGMYKLHTDLTQARTSQLPQDFRKTNKRVSFSTGIISTTSVSRPQLKSNPMGDRVMRNNSQGKKQEVEDQRRNVKLSKNKTSVTACNDSLNAKTLNVNFVSATCDKCVLNDKHDMCVLNSVAKPLKKQLPQNPTRSLETFIGSYMSILVRLVVGGIPSLHHQDTNGNLSLEKKMLIQILVCL
nr:hypothetical protein [Tanacetum cinerariifolium]